MRLLFLIAAIIVIVVMVIIALTGGTWATTVHLLALLGIALGAFFCSFLPIPSVGP
jgi:ABC-type Fe3+-siderophore transport system permease subunit